jgi:hypothetical protein
MRNAKSELEATNEYAKSFYRHHFNMTHSYFSSAFLEFMMKLSSFLNETLCSAFIQINKIFRHSSDELSKNRMGMPCWLHKQG